MKNMPAFTEFEKALMEARVNLKVAKGTLEHIEDTAKIPSDAYSLMPELEKAFEDIKKSVNQDITRYIPSKKEAEPLKEENSEHADFTSPPPHEVGEDLEIEEQAKFFTFLTRKLKKALYRPIESSDIIEQDKFDTLTPQEQYLYMLIAREIDGIESIPLIQKLKRILASVGAKRIEEAVILSKNSRKDDPHNHSISFILSQLLYYKSCNGHSECLPEARDEAKKACAYTEKVGEQRLLRYRYHSIATERHFSPEKCVKIMREYYMTNPESLTGREGVAANNFYNLRCWVILSTIPTNLWSKFEVESLAEIITKTIGGSLIYIYYLREIILSELDAGNEVFTKNLQELEKLLANFYIYYNRMKASITTNFDSQFSIKGSQPYTWITAHRYMKKFLAIAPLPSSDEILMHISLDGHSSEKTAYPEANMAKVGLVYNDYWRSWAAALTPFEGTRQASAVPYQRLEEVKTLFSFYTQLLEKLENLEKETLKDENWAEIQSFMPLYAYENLLEIGHGGPSTHLLRTKEDAPFLPYYREWRKETIPASRPSEIIKQHAENGAFINFKEVHTFFEGVYRVFSSHQYNLQKHMLDARAAYNAKYDIKSGINFGRHMKDTWWLYFIILPMIIVTTMVTFTSTDPASAVKTMAIIIGGFVFFIAVVIMILPSNKEK